MSKLKTLPVSIMISFGILFKRENCYKLVNRYDNDTYNAMFLCVCCSVQVIVSANDFEDDIQLVQKRQMNPKCTLVKSGTVPEYVGDKNGASVERRLPHGSNGTKQMMVDKKVDKGKVIWLGVLGETFSLRRQLQLQLIQSKHVLLLPGLTR